MRGGLINWSNSKLLSRDFRSFCLTLLSLEPLYPSSRWMILRSKMIISHCMNCSQGSFFFLRLPLSCQFFVWSRCALRDGARVILFSFSGTDERRRFHYSLVGFSLIRRFLLELCLNLVAHSWDSACLYVESTASVSGSTFSVSGLLLGLLGLGFLNFASVIGFASLAGALSVRSFARPLWKLDGYPFKLVAL